MPGNRIDGRPTEKPVMTIALAWSPEQSPTRADMIGAAESFLTHMGWQEHQCLMVAHGDTKHPHVHLIVNRVHPETGMGIDDAWRKHRAQEWSLAFEREQGVTYPSLYDPTGKLMLRFEKGTLNPQAIPSTLVLDRQGRIAARSLAALSEDKLRKMIAPVLAEK